MSDIDCDLLVLGGGPGGYVCGIRAGQLGLKTVLIEERHLGGTCLNVGCIPSKALIHVADRFHEMARAAEGRDEVGLTCASPSLDLAKTVAWKDGLVGKLTGGVGTLLRRAGVEVIEGTARMIDGKTAEVGGRRVRAKAVVLATGSERVELPGLAMGGNVIGSREALDLAEVPARLAVIGAGYIGLEIGTAFAKMGSKVTILEAGDRALPLYDAALVKPVVDRLPALGVDLRLGARAEGFADGRLRLADGRSVEADTVLVAVGRRPRTDAFAALDLAMDGPFVRIDDRCATSMRGVFAVGDVTGEPLLAHRAMAQGEMVAEIAAGRRRRWDGKAIPAVCFTDPEIVSVGAGPDAEGSVTGVFPFRANGRAMTLEREDGFVRLVARAADHAVIGAHAVGVGVAEMVSAFVTAIEMGARLEDVGAVVQAHPTQSEGFQEAALKALGHAIHV